MAIPNAFDDIDDLHYYQGVIIAEVASTLALYIILRVIHYLIWGADEEAMNEKGPGAEGKEPPSEEEDRFVKVVFYEIK